MVDHNLIRSLGISESDIEAHLAEALGSDYTAEAMSGMIDETLDHKPGTILKGQVVSVFGNEVIIEVGFKSEGSVDIREFDDPSSIEPGQEVEVLLESVESDSGLVDLSKRKADRIRGWERIVANNDEGDIVKGIVTRNIKGGLLVDIGVPAFLPASQVDIRRPGDITAFIGKEIEAKILKIDEDRRNIVVSRRKLIEERRHEAREKLMSEIEIGQLRKGLVKNLADFGAFVDLGGVDGLLHITDMSWGRIGHPSEIVKVDEEIEVVILSIDQEKDKISLGLKQKTPNPWSNVEEKYPVASRIKGTVVNIVSYGAFVKLEEGLEGLVHISEMSWTRRINHPSEIVTAGQEIDIVVLEIDKDKQEISLGIKQAEANPWMEVKAKYPPGTVITGIVRNMTNYGAFIEIEEGIDGLLHVSDISWTRKVGHPSEALKKNEKIQCVVLAVDEDKMRVSLGLKQLTEDPWLRSIPEHYIPGQIVKGKVTKITNFGVFVELENNLEGLLHVSEMADHKVENPQDVVNVDEEIEVKILRVDTEDRKIGLSLKRAQWAAEDGAEGTPSPGALQRRGGLAGEGGLGDLAETILKTSREPREQTQETPSAPADEEAPIDQPPEEEAPAESAEPTDDTPAQEQTEETPSAPAGEKVPTDQPAEETPAESESHEQPAPDAETEEAQDKE